MKVSVKNALSHTDWWRGHKKPSAYLDESNIQLPILAKLGVANHGEQFIFLLIAATVLGPFVGVFAFVLLAVGCGLLLYGGAISSQSLELRHLRYLAVMDDISTQEAKAVLDRKRLARRGVTQPLHDRWLEAKAKGEIGGEVIFLDNDLESIAKLLR